MLDNFLKYASNLMEAIDLQTKLDDLQELMESRLNDMSSEENNFFRLLSCHLKIEVDDFKSGVIENGSVCIDASPHYTYDVVGMDMIHKGELMFTKYSNPHRFFVPLFDYIDLIKPLTKLVSIDGKYRFLKLVFVMRGEKLGAYFIQLKDKV